jgi:hypothetical protein
MLVRLLFHVSLLYLSDDDCRHFRNCWAINCQVQAGFSCYTTTILSPLYRHTLPPPRYHHYPTTTILAYLHHPFMQTTFLKTFLLPFTTNFLPARLHHNHLSTTRVIAIFFLSLLAVVLSCPTSRSKCNMSACTTPRLAACLLADQRLWENADNCAAN